MSSHLLKRAPERARPRVELLPDIRLEQARAHEACGASRRVFALWLAARLEGPVLWITPGWGMEQLNPHGVHDFMDPNRILYVKAQRAEDLLWSVEETLRAGVIPLVVADLPAPPGLTPVRRMHLAAEEGGETQKPPPMALLLTPGDGGAQGVESRWHMAPAFGEQPRLWRLDRVRARTRPPQSWHLYQARPGTLPTPVHPI